jgi:hypothetical protein
MAETKDLPSSAASFSTPFMNTTGKCLEFFYWISQDKNVAQVWPDEETFIAVVATSEELERKVINTTVIWDYSDYQRKFIYLPAGVNQISIVGNRTKESLANSISIDEITLMDCSKFGKITTFQQWMKVFVIYKLL